MEKITTKYVAVSKPVKKKNLPRVRSRNLFKKTQADYDNLSLDELDKLRKKFQRKHVSNKAIEQQYKKVIKAWRAKRKEQERIIRHRRQERGNIRKRRLQTIQEHKLRQSDRSPSDILSKPFMYLINHPIDFQAVDYEVQNIRMKHDQANYFSKYIQQHIYNIYEYNDIVKALNDVYKNSNHAFKLNVSFGIVFERPPLLDKAISEITIHEPSNKFYFNYQHAVRNAKDMSNLIVAYFSDTTLKEHYEALAPDTKTRLIGIYSMGIKITLLDYAIGANINLPPHIRNSPCIISLDNVENNMCFWACLALMNGARKDRYKKRMRTLFTDFYKRNNSNYEGFDYANELDQVEELHTSYAINIVTFKEDREIEYIRKSNYNDTRISKYINLYENHFSYITNFEKLGKCFSCGQCGYKARFPNEVNRHTCDKEPADVFAKSNNALWIVPRNTVVELSDYYETEVSDYKYDYLVTYDLEAIQIKETSVESTNLKYVTKHVPVSCSIASNIPGHTSPVCIISTNPKELCIKIFQHFEKLSNIAGDLMLQKYSTLYNKIVEMGVEDDRKKLKDYINSLPIVGFNSNFYDIGLLVKEGFMHEIYKRDKKPFIVKDGSRYKVIKTQQFLFLDQMYYCSPGTSLSSFIKAYDIDESKGYFPYEWFDSYHKLDYKVQDLTMDDFYSSLRNSTLARNEFDKLMTYCRENNIILIRNLLEWYNNLDVRPMLEACLKQKQFYYQFELDMYKDGFSLPSLSKTILYKFSIKDFDEYLKKDVPENVSTIYPEELGNKINRYKAQDKMANRTLDNYITVDGFQRLLKASKYRCHYCWKEIVGYNLSLDRINNLNSHTEENCVISCRSCNCQRKNTLYKKFYREKAMIRFSKEVPLIHLIDDENKEVFYKLRASMSGGLSLVFHRYHEKEVTRIQRTEYDCEYNNWYIGEETNFVNRIVGYDANALYLWCLGEEMLCGQLKLIETDDMKYVYDKKFFGFLEVDIEVPKDLYNYFSELPPIVKNAEYDESVCGEYTKNLLKKLHKEPHKTRKLIATMKGEKIVIKSTRLHWLISKGCVVTKLHSVIPATPRRCFEGFMKWVSDERRKGDRDMKYSIIAEGAKTVGNSAFGHTIMNKAKHKKTTLCGENIFNKFKNLARYYDANVYTIDDDKLYEVTLTKKSQRQNIPLMVGCSVFDDSKLRMYQFYYDFVDKFIDRSNFQYLEMDTDSAYMALTGDFDNLIKPELRAEYDKEKYDWFCRKDNAETAAYEKRIPGKMKVEYEGTGMICLCSKSYITWNGKIHKSSCKGAQKRRNIYGQVNYVECLFKEQFEVAVNMGFRLKDNQIKTYIQNKIGLSPVYNKGIVLSNKINIAPLNI